jgi:site-specific DNA recombinase
MNRAVIYTRVSTTRQAEEGVSLDAQLAKARQWCELNDHKIVGEFSDNGISGKKVSNRPGLQVAVDVACENACTLVVLSMSRLSRSVKDFIAVSERLDKAGADLVSLSESIDTTTATGKVIFHVMASFAQYYRDQVSEQTRTALAHKRAKGEKTGGAVPYGFDADESGKLTENPDEQEVIKRIKGLKAVDCSLRAIVRSLNQTNTPTKNGGKWHPQTVKGILERG